MLDLTQWLADKDREKKGKSGYLALVVAFDVFGFLTNSYCCRSGGGNRSPPEGEGPAQPGACSHTGGRAKGRRRSEDQEPRAGW
jgi:hypothetical protein